MKKSIYSILVFLLFTIFIYCISAKLAVGAGWSSGLHLGGVDNYLYENGTMYTIPNQGFTPGSSYFPGVLFLSILCRKIFGYGAETAIIIIGGIIAIFTFWGFSRICSDKTKDRFWFAVLSTVFFTIEFSWARAYLLEMHPDIPALTFFLWGIIFVDKYLQKDKVIYLLPVSFAFWCSGLFKQNAVALYIGLGSYILFSKSISVRNKILIIFSEALAGIATLVVVFTIDGCWYNCVTVNSLHPFLSLKVYLQILYSTLINNFIFLIACLLYIILLLTKKIFLQRTIEKLWFSASLGWGVFCMYGAAKDGANEGNMEAAIIAFMPFVLLLIKKIFFILKEYYVEKDLQRIIKFKNTKLLLYIAVIFSMIGFSGVLLLKSYKRFFRFNERLVIQKEFSSWLTENYKEQNIAYDTHFYELLNGANINKTTDFYTFYIWNLGGIVSDSDLQELSKKEGWDVIIVHSALDEKKYPLTFKKFVRLPQTDYPDCSLYYGSQIEVYVRK